MLIYTNNAGFVLFGFGWLAKRENNSEPLAWLPRRFLHFCIRIRSFPSIITQFVAWGSKWNFVRKRNNEAIIITVTLEKAPPVNSSQPNNNSIWKTSHFSPITDSCVCFFLLSISRSHPRHHQHWIKFYFPLISSSIFGCFVFASEKRLNWFKAARFSDKGAIKVFIFLGLAGEFRYMAQPAKPPSVFKVRMKNILITCYG